MVPWIKGRAGSFTNQAHVDVPAGTCEEEYARLGFSGRYAHLYRSSAPVDWVNIEGELRPRAYDTKAMKPLVEDYLTARTPLLRNNDVRLNMVKLRQAPEYFFRNADSDELFFVHAGRGTIETDFGPLNYETGDYVSVPRGTVYRLVPEVGSQFLLIESASEFNFPEKGMLGQHALFDPAMLTVPDPSNGTSLLSKRSLYELKILRNDRLTKVFYEKCPLNTVAWKGTLSVWKLNVRDIRPISCDRYHLPPSAHTTLVAKNFVICTFLPRPLENGDPGAMKVPFYHSNIDYDEVLFYHSGDFFSRSGIGEGMLTFHPQGIHHGPHPKAIERVKDLSHTNEVAVMVDTRYPLEPTEASSKIEVQDYWQSWRN